MKSLLGLSLAATSVFYTFEANAAQFSCSGGDVTCLVASINSANQRGGKHTITLEPGVYTLTAVDNTVNGNTTLPVIMGNIRIRAASDTEPTAIENNTGFGSNSSRIFFISTFGNLTLDGIILQNTSAEFDLLRNFGTTSIQNSRITGIGICCNTGGTSPVHNFGKLTVTDSILDSNQASMAVAAQ